VEYVSQGGDIVAEEMRKARESSERNIRLAALNRAENDVGKTGRDGNILKAEIRSRRS
jgi:hypothetical protein